jgi:hypothetical protein
VFDLLVALREFGRERFTLARRPSRRIVSVTLLCAKNASRCRVPFEAAGAAVGVCDLVQRIGDERRTMGIAARHHC